MAAKKTFGIRLIICQVLPPGSLQPRLLCSLRSPPAYHLPLLLSLRSRLTCLLPSPCLLLASLALPAVCFARRLSLPLLALLAASPALPGASLKGRLSCMLAMYARHLAYCSRFNRQFACLLLAPLAASPAARFARRWLLAAPAAAGVGRRSHLLVLLTASLALPASPAPHTFLHGRQIP